MRDISARKQAERELQEAARIAELGAAVGFTLSRDDSLPDQLRLCSEALAEYLDAAFVRIWTLAPSGDMLEVQASAGLYAQIDGEHARIPVGRSRIGLIAQEQRAYLTDRVLDDPLVDPEWARRQGLVALAGFPLLIGDRLVGVMAVFARHSFDQTVTDAMASIASAVALGIERKSAEASLRESEARFRLLAENSTDILAKRSPEGIYLYISPACRAFLGYEPEEIVGRNAMEFVHPDDLSKVRGALAEALAGPEPRTATYRAVRKNGSYTWAETIFRAVYDSQASRVDQLHTLSRDVSARVAVEDALRLARDQLEARVQECTVELVRANASLEYQAKELSRSNAELQQFAYVASHDLQEPLRMVASYTQLLARRYRDRLDADASDFIGYAVDGVTRMQVLINDLLTYSRVGSTEKRFTPTPLQDVLKRALANLQTAIEESGAVVTHDPLPVVKGDAPQLVQLFQNLIGNAIKYRGEKPPQIHVSVCREDGNWRVAVRDNGIGIEPQYAERIFEIFQRLHTADQYSGTGIGLAICRKIVERHGGRIWVESQAGMGATFHLTIPAHAEGKRSDEND